MKWIAHRFGKPQLSDIKASIGQCLPRTYCWDRDPVGELASGFRAALDQLTKGIPPWHRSLNTFVIGNARLGIHSYGETGAF